MGKARGFVLVGALVMVLVLGVLVTTATFSGYSNRINTSDAINAYQAQLAAEAGLDYALYKVWHERWGNEQDRSYAKYLPKINTFLPIGPNNPHPKYTLPEPIKLDEKKGISYDIIIERRDVIDNTSGDNVITFNLTSTGLLADNYTARKLQQTIQIREPQRGFDFALLTNNANCIFCHTRVRPMEALGGAPSEQLPWRRLKIGVLESLEIRRTDDISSVNHDAKSFVAGTIYTRGKLSISKFVNDSSPRPYANETVLGGVPDIRFKTLQAPGQLEITNESLKSFNTVNCQGGSCKPGENFYFNYPDRETVKNNNWVWPDEELPDKFPLPVADENKNRVIDDPEWNMAVNNSKAGLDRYNLPGQITGSGITKVSTTLTGWPSGGNTLTSGDKANVVLDGQKGPLAITGTVYVDGDVILRGPIQGKGKLIVRGNAYVLGDVTYRCGNQDCTNQQYAEGARNPRRETLPRFALSAGGNVIIGDFLTPRYSRDYRPPPYGDGTIDTDIDTGCLDPLKLGDVASGCSIYSFTMQEIAVFNEKQLIRALEDPNSSDPEKRFVPRFYTLAAGQPVYFNSHNSGVYDHEGAGSYWFTDYLSSSRPDNAQVRVRLGGINTVISGARARQILNIAAVTSLAPKNGWVDGPTLKRLWNSSIERSVVQRPGNGEFRFDGLLYSANGIFSIIRNRLNPTTLSKTNGSWDLRGAMVAADTGVLTPGSPVPGQLGGLDPSRQAALSIYYDQRMANFFSVRDLNELRPYRSDWKVVAR